MISLISKFKNRSRKFQRNSWQKKTGFTLIEMIVVVVIIVIVYSFTVPNFSRYNSRKKLELASAQVAEVVSLARSHAITFREEVIMTFSPATGEYYYNRAIDPGIARRVDKLHRLDPTVSFSATPGQITFEPNGNIASGVQESVTLMGAKNKTITFSINPRTGYIDKGNIT